jgi:hypothetical protein
MSKKFFIESNPIVAAFVATVLLASITMMSFVVLEPGVSYAITDTFTIEQEITSEIAFQTAAGDVIMSPDLAGITGGVSSGTSTVAVTTNDVDGYTLQINFADSVAMQYESGTDSIPNYDAVGTPDYNFTFGSGDAFFALSASSTNVASIFRSNGSNTCNTGTTRSANKCWFMESNATTLLTLVDRSSSTPAEGETTIIGFRVGVNDPTPALPAGFYNATATLTALVK